MKTTPEASDAGAAAGAGAATEPAGGAGTPTVAGGATEAPTAAGATPALEGAATTEAAFQSRWHRATAQFEDWLFPPAPIGQPHRAAVVARYLAGCAAVAALALLRQSGMPAWRTLWAEDGRVFYSQALSLPFTRTLVTLHDGYVQLYPRLIAELATVFPPGDAPWVMALAGAVSLGAISGLVFHMTRAHVASPVLRALLGLSMVLLPVAGAELLDNAVNVPWWLFFACFWALLWQPRTLSGRVGAALLCALSAASEPLTALLLPVAALRVAALGPPYRSGGIFAHAARPAGTRSITSSFWFTAQAPVVGLLAGLVFQAVAIMTHAGNRGVAAAFSPGSAKGLGQSLAIRTGLGLVTGARGTDSLVAHDRALATALGALVLLAIVLAGGLCPSSRARAFTAAAVFTALTCFLVPTWLRDVAPLMASGKVQPASRYQAVPLLLLLSVVVVGAEGWVAGVGRRRPGRVARAPRGSVGGEPPRRALAPGHFSAHRGRHGAKRGRPDFIAATVCVALLAPTWAADFRDANARSSGPSWPVGIARAAERCAGSSLGKEAIPIDPRGWTALVPCRLLLR
ncbi:MAG: hypothetical protein M0005_00035 [Actinomycetota bacterium]|nr:hypothetical protein [Actinomycetota bacterium]